MLRRLSPLLIVGVIAVVAACDSLSGLPGASGTPVGIALMNARTTATGYTTYPRVTFYSAGTATFSFSTVASDTCVVAPYDTTTSTAPNATEIGAGAIMRATYGSGALDTLIKSATGDQTYHPSSLSGIPFTPGDSVLLEVAGDAAGFPQLDVTAKTAEPFTITKPTIPPAGQSMLITWTPATDNNAAMYVSLLYNSGGGTALNTQIFCDFHDDGQGTVQPYLMAALSSSAAGFQLLAQRVRTNLVVNPAGTAYFNAISTFEVPTPVSP